MITAEMLKKLDDRALKHYRREITNFHQTCLRFDFCYRVPPVFHEHFKEIEKLLTEEINRRKKLVEQHRSEAEEVRKRNEEQKGEEK